jgi:hypothetical protein
MSWKHFTCSSNIRDIDDHSRKYCCCGGHNSSNVKCNLNHNSTHQKLLVRKARKMKRYLLTQTI